MDEVYEIADWKKVSVLGSGGFGEVTLWKNVVTDEYIAIKKSKFVMPSSLTSKQKERWKKEVEIMKQMKHQNVVSFVDIPKNFEKGLLRNNPTKLPIMSMEYCWKGNLRHLMQKPQNISGLEEQDVRCVLSDILSGLQYLHSLKITHRDIKPENIVLQHCNERQGKTIFKIIDLGYAKELNDSTVSYVGTLHYLAPEMYESLNYDNSVDYWSFGVTTFEIICGVLPFLSHLSPPERFAHLRKKKTTDICIYLNYSGEVTYSSNLKEEIQITSSLKYHIEEWLQHVLQIDPVERAKNSVNGGNVLEYLQQILKKKILKMFALHNLQFYSLEINENTSIGTLKDWISTNTGIDENDLILLFKNDVLVLSKDQLPDEVLNLDDYLFVLNKNGIIQFPISYTFPKLIKEVMKSALEFKPGYLWQLYGQAVYYISTERLRSCLLRMGLQYYVNYIKKITEKLRCKYISVSKKVGNLLVRIDCCTFIHKHGISGKRLCNNIMYQQCLIFSGKLLSYLQEHLNYYREFKARLNNTFKRLRILINVWPKIVELVNNLNLKNQYDLVMNLLVITDNGKDAISLKKEVTTMVSQSILFKETLLKNDTFRAFLKGMANVQRNVEFFLVWIAKFDKNIQDISHNYMKNEVRYWDVHVKAANEYYENSQLPFRASDLLKFDGCDITKESIFLMNQ